MKTQQKQEKRTPDIPIPANGTVQTVNPAAKNAGHGMDPNFVAEQYTQYYNMLRHHTSLSWSIPSFAVACSVLFFGLDSSRIETWHANPLLPACCFLFIGLFLSVLLVHHQRNSAYAGKFDKVLYEMESKWGFPADVHHCQVKSRRGLTSSICLALFLGLTLLTALAFSGYFFYLFFNMP